MSGAAPTPRLERAAPIVALLGWFVVMVLVAASLLARHLIPLPPPTHAQSASALAAARAEEAKGRWTTFHVLLGSCRCSRLVGQHLLTSARPPGLVEHVLLVGADPGLRAGLVARGFTVIDVEPEALSQRFHIESAPLFVVLGPEGTPRYLGGYTARKQGADVRDLAIFAALQRAEVPSSLPLFGCAVSKRLLAAIDPLSLR